MNPDTFMKTPCRPLCAGLTLAAAPLFAACGPIPGVEAADSMRAAMPRAEAKAIVVLRPSARKSESPLLAQLRETGRVRRRLSTIPAIAASLTEDEIAALGGDSAVAYVEADQTLEAVPSSPGAEETASWGAHHIGASAARARGITGANVKVAVLDTGVDYTHPELSPRFSGGYNFLANTSDPLDDSYDSHGTQVAGIIAASLDGDGMVGVAPGVSLYAVKVLDGGGFGDLSAILAGIDWAVANHMDVINMSFGTRMASRALEDACNAADAAGIVLVAATGYRGADPVSYPAAYASVIGVSATDQNDLITTFSPAGPGVALVAPGLSILSTQRGGGYVTLSGTSQAAPHVSGVAALILGAGIADANGDGRLSDEVREKLLTTARDLGAAGRDDPYGYGLADVRAALGLCQATGTAVVRTAGSLQADARLLSLAASRYELELINHGLAAVRAYARPRGEEQWTTFRTVHLKPRMRNPVAFTAAFEVPNEIKLVPQGPAGGWAQVSATDTGAGCR